MRLDLIVLPYESAERLRYLMGDAADMVGFRLPREDAEELVRVAEQVIEGAKQQLAMRTCPYCNKMASWEGVCFWHASDDSEMCLKCGECGSLIREDGSKLRDVKELRR
jgi:hypothetical protein